ncbi:MAG: type I pullulanase [Acholeplasmatales bacterium]|nr:type I pullulanase [Acholeplasmatales bacterium]
MFKGMKAYIDSYELISILVEKSLCYPIKVFYLVDGDFRKRLEYLDLAEDCQEFYKYRMRFDYSIELNKEYIIEDESGNRCFLRSGSIIRSPEFERKFAYDGPLGAEYHKEYTIFRAWSPVAKKLMVELYKDSGKERYDFTYVNKGLWECVVEGDLDGIGYLYFVKVNERLQALLDPYAISSAENEKYNYVVNPDKFYKMKYPMPEFSGIYTDAVIYEASVRDFTNQLKSENCGTFLGMVENNPTDKGPTGLDYIKSLGITHLQLLPTYDFGGVDDVDKDSRYNWGYNPDQYMVPCGWYSKHPEDPYSRINELLELIDECHKRGIRVIMDVVFNHVYHWKTFGFEKLVPGYPYRVNLDATVNNASGCGNTMATEKYMNSRFITDVLTFYVKTYKVSGFRFDLMGLLDINSLNNSFKKLKELEPNIMLYGEGWNMDNPLPDEFRPHMYNHKKTPGYAFFNDRYRDYVRGSQWDKQPGYAFGSGKSLYDLHKLVLGSCLDYYRFDEPNQTINYVECHDNYTFYDYGYYAISQSDEAVRNASRLALELILISIGVPFIHAGQEFFRTKRGVENAYNSSDYINMIDYRRRDEYIDNVNIIRDLIQIRKEYDCFRISTKEEVLERIHKLDGVTTLHTAGLVAQNDGFNLYVIAKNDSCDFELEIGKSEMIFDGFGRCSKKEEKYILQKPGVYIFRKDK